MCHRRPFGSKDQRLLVSHPAVLAVVKQPPSNACSTDQTQNLVRHPCSPAFHVPKAAVKLSQKAQLKPGA
jgi:hypothetical protein